MGRTGGAGLCKACARRKCWQCNRPPWGNSTGRADAEPGVDGGPKANDPPGGAAVGIADAAGAEAKSDKMASISGDTQSPLGSVGGGGSAPFSFMFALDVLAALRPMLAKQFPVSVVAELMKVIGSAPLESFTRIGQVILKDREATGFGSG